jgi:hypothetical protein
VSAVLCRTCVWIVALCGIVSITSACDPFSSQADPGAGDEDGDGDGNADDGDGDADDGDGDADGDADSDGDADGDGDGPDKCPGPQGETDITFPMAVDGYFFVTGYSGDGETGNVVEGSCPQRGGEARGDCHSFTYAPGGAGWAAVFWQYPHDNWGGAPGRTIPEGATAISFYAWSEAGGEKVQFGAGLDGQDSFGVKTPELTMTTEPTRYTISLADVAVCDDVVSAFLWSAPAPSASMVLYVDDIVWEGVNGGDDDDDLPPLDPSWPAGPGAQGVSLRVRNHCAFPLFIGGTGKEATLSPARVRLGRGELHDYDVPKKWSAARVNAFGAEADSDPREKVELTLYRGGDGADHLSYNVTYVDWLGLPVEITSLGGACSAAEHTTGCSVREAEVRNGCPQSFLLSGNRCLSPRTYCTPSRQSEDYCHLLDEAIAACDACPAATTPEVYSCSGPYADEPRWCAALNRAMTHDPDNANAGAYYQSPPYNDYARWVHEVCPGIYAFPYDDWLSHGGYRDCSGGNEIRITFCPGG